MNIRHSLLVVLCATGLMAGSSQESPKPSAAILGPVAFQTLAAGSYFHLSAQVTYAEMNMKTPALARELSKLLKEAGIQTFGPLLMIQQGASQDQSKPFTLEVGILVPKGTKALGEAKVRELASFPCATTILRGDLAGEGAKAAFISLFKAAGEQGRIATGEIREMLLLWEDLNSSNNLMQIQIGLQ